jgi:hypothetical protein
MPGSANLSSTQLLQISHFLTGFRGVLFDIEEIFSREQVAPMSKLKLTLACWNYDRTRALIGGRVQAEGIDLDIKLLRPRETFRECWRTKSSRFRSYRLLLTPGAVLSEMTKLPLHKRTHCCSSPLKNCLRNVPVPTKWDNSRKFRFSYRIRPAMMAG